jgi:xanthine dehydrogenase YagS FAD-binding subunit
MKEFTHINAITVDEAVSALNEYGTKASVIAGGTDLLGELIVRCRLEQPEYIINLKTIDGLDYISEDSSGLRIGALTTLSDIASSSIVRANYTALAQAARKVASLQIRNMGTIGGNICQQTRCWYYRVTDNKFFCFRKGGTLCQATLGDHRFHHSIFGGAGSCFAAHPSDTAPALIALDAKIATSQRTINAEEFFDGLLNTVLADDEIVTEIQIPTPPAGSKSIFEKASIRRAIDFALANVAILVTPATGTISSARVALNAVATVPIRATAAEEVLVGNTVSQSIAEEAADAAVDDTFALPHNGYKISVTKGIIKRALLA